ncbi:ParA family protein [Methanofollis ethanolicus]|uniref:ParA family protein n=1 Tax=Methanofollis ethanolicus TaxID=488124 RepID=UPI002E26BB9B
MRILIRGERISRIAFAHHKGGTGKTTSCLNIAGYLQTSGRSVLVVDCDPQANATSGLGIVPGSTEKTVYDLFMRRFDDYPDVSPAEVIVQTASGIDLLPSSLDLVGAEPYLYTIDDRASVLKDALDEIADLYDMVLIDTPPSMGQLVINSLVAADHAIVTLDPGVFSLGGVSTMKTIFQDIQTCAGGTVRPEIAIIGPGSRESAPRKGFFSSFFHRLFPADEDGGIEAEVAKTFLRVEKVPYSPEIPMAQKEGVPISHYAPACPAGRVYRNIAAFVEGWN